MLETGGLCFLAGLVLAVWQINACGAAPKGCVHVRDGCDSVKKRVRLG